MNPHEEESTREWAYRGIKAHNPADASDVFDDLCYFLEAHIDDWYGYGDRTPALVGFLVELYFALGQDAEALIDKTKDKDSTAHKRINSILRDLRTN